MNPIDTPIPAKIKEWLLDPSQPGARYLALKHLGQKPRKEIRDARREAHRSGPIATMLEAMHPEGYWDNDGPGYLPKDRSSAWSLSLLAQLGAAIEEDPRIRTACSRYLDRALAEGGQVSSSGTPGGTVDCLQGNMLAAFSLLGYQDPRLEKAYEWMARTTTGEGIAPMGEKSAPQRYYSGKIGPDFLCGANNKLACAWGAAKVMLAFSRLQPAERTPLIERAIQRGLDFLFSCDPATAAYPSGWAPKPSGNWWKFGFPVFYVTDLLQVYQVLSDLGFAADPRLTALRQLILDKRAAEGSWLMEYGYQGKTWEDFGEKKKPNKWVTIRAYRALGSVLSL